MTPHQPDSEPSSARMRPPFSRRSQDTAPKPDRQAEVVAVCRSSVHGFSKYPCGSIRLIAGVGVAGDAHAGTTVQHRSRVRANPQAPNLRQVHLLQSELLDELAAAGYALSPCSLGENITTVNLPLLSLPTGAILQIGSEVRLELTGLRNPCGQIETFRPGLLALVSPRDKEGGIERRCGVMAIVLHGGTVEAGCSITVALPPPPHRPLAKV